MIRQEEKLLVVMEGEGLISRSGTWSMTEAVTEARLCMCVGLGVENGY